jgi:hypothetical protein
MPLEGETIMTPSAPTPATMPTPAAPAPAAAPMSYRTSPVQRSGYQTVAPTNMRAGSTYGNVSRTSGLVR